jgi:hypothetical protein
MCQNRRTTATDESGGRSRRAARSLLVAVALTAGCAVVASAGPPFLTDDPETVQWRHFEAYLFGTANRGPGGSAFAVPAFEFNVGAAPNLQLHVVVPASYVTPGRAFGLGDIELGAKYRFVGETDTRPQIGIFPQIELPSGDSRRDLGHGSLWARLPVWVQKSRGPWTTYGGVGYEVNRAPGMEDSFFAGWLVQRQITKRLILGTEVYHQNAQAVGARHTTFTNVGGYYTLRGELSLLVMVGHTVSGERHSVGYLGLYYTWGHDRPANIGAVARHWTPRNRTTGW